jgi:hypothetical protein
MKRALRLFLGMMALSTALLFAPAAWAAPGATSFDLFPNARFIPCMSSGVGTPSAHATVIRGELNDQMRLNLNNFKPGLAFDLFTVQRSNQQADGTPVPGFTSFGLAWYQSDVQVERRPPVRGVVIPSNGSVTIRTILLDQIFGFDPDVSLPPTNTFHVGFWFNDPADAAACGFTGSTPFNGDHHAGPLAFITRPDAKTGLGPLCTNPTSSTPPACNP